MEILKKILIVLFCVTLAILVYTACKPVVKDEGKTDDNQDYRGAPEQIITLGQAKELFDNYTERRVNLIEEYESREGQESFDASRYGEYDYETIKQYLAFIEHEAKAANVKISKLRIYFGNYPEKEKFEDGRAVKYPRKNTFLILPTLKKGADDYGFYINQGKDGKKEALLITERFPQDPGQKMGNVGSGTQSYASFVPNTAPSPYFAEESLILNEGSMIPPPRKKTDF
ncbi:hypothetical protein K8352_13795 [Flavobacteriaceae bacterium F89]|uniref:Uncharacterized protein n=1 Tax=Cerina litoralis TaxID=2874477 RepID=A0AAE3EY26_9FLAO|nr:hypothetical protein [Cerina litoralis]MCG2461827.1 hypothetical protein [Cerina litoralis]